MYLQLDTKFNPFTYDEMVKPLLYYKQAYDEAEAAYSDLATQTETWKDIVNRENSPEAFEMYQRYSGDLSKAVDDFSQGMTAKNRRALLGLKRRYAQDITPIARASEAMNAANELRAKAGPDAIFEVGEYNSLDQFLHGKTANNKYQSREALTKKTAAMTEAAMAEALKDPDFEKYMGDQFWLITQHTGGSYEDLKEAMKLGMMDNPIAQNRFSQIRQEVAKNAGIQNYDAAGQQAIMDAIDTGLYAGLDKPVRNFQANADHITPVQRHSMAMQDAQLALSAASSGMVRDSKGNWKYDLSRDPAVAKARARTSSGSSSGSSRSSSSGSESSSGSSGRANRMKQIMKVRATNNGGGSGDYSVGSSWQLESVPDGAPNKSYGELTTKQKSAVDKLIPGDSRSGYNYYVITEDASGVGTGDDDFVIIEPKNTVVIGTEEIDTDAH